MPPAAATWGSTPSMYAATPSLAMMPPAGPQPAQAPLLPMPDPAHTLPYLPQQPVIQQQPLPQTSLYGPAGHPAGASVGGPYAGPQFAPLPGPMLDAPLMNGGLHDGYFQSMLASGITGTIDDPHVIRIPIRVLPGETPRIHESDVTLEDGDIVFIEARDSEVFYTGGLLGGGQFTLPRDHDLRALEAVSIAQAQGPRGGTSRSSGGVSALNQDVTISASKLIVVRKLADGTSVPIEIDLNRAKGDMTGRENIVIQPGDYLYLQYSCIEAVGAFFERHLLEGALFGVAAAQFQSGN